MIADVRLGDTQAVKMYRGDDIVWEKQSGELPAGYTQVKYIEGNEKQCISTGITTNDIDYYRIVGAIIANDSSIFSDGKWADSDTLMFSSGAGVNFWVNRVIVRTDPYTFGDIFEAEWGDSFTSFNLVSKPTVRFNKSANYLYVFPLSGLSASRYGRGKVCQICMQMNGVIVANLLPVIDPFGKPCMFDTVTKQPLYNSGTGELGYELMDGTYVAPI